MMTARLVAAAAVGIIVMAIVWAVVRALGLTVSYS